MHLQSTIRMTSAMLALVCAVSAVFPANISAQQTNQQSTETAAKASSAKAPQKFTEVELEERTRLL